MRTQYYFNDILTKKCTTKSNHEKLSDKARNNYSIKKKKRTACSLQKCLERQRET